MSDNIRAKIKSFTAELEDGGSVTYDGGDGYVIVRQVAALDAPYPFEAFAHILLPREHGRTSDLSGQPPPEGAA